MTSLETLLAAANFVEANDRPDSLANGSCYHFNVANSCSLVLFCCIIQWCFI